MPEINKDNEALLTQEELKKLLHYDPDTGWFTWKVDRGKRRLKGKRAGSRDRTGYRRLTLNYKYYGEHRLVFLYMEGEWPPNIVDHKNRVRDDNRWDNLRHSTHSDNQLNKGKSRDVLPMKQEECKERYHYCKDTGVFTHRLGRHKGKEMGSVRSYGGRLIYCKGKCYMADKLAFLYVTGEYPIGLVSHKDGDKSNNAWDNLELVAKKRSKVKGVVWDKDKQKWKAQVNVKGKCKHLGRFKEEQDALKAVEEYRLKHNLDFIQTSDDGYQ